jgi:lipoate-protein ligase A
MADKARILFTGLNSAFFNMGLDEAILNPSPQALSSTLRFYGWTPSAISLGYFQGYTKKWIPKLAAKKEWTSCAGSPGRAVFHDTEVTYSIVIRGTSLAPIRSPIPTQSSAPESSKAWRSGGGFRIRPDQ